MERNFKKVGSHHVKDEDDEISLKELIIKLKGWIQHLWSKRLLILATFVIGCSLGFLYSKLKQPLYTAVCTFVLEEDGSGGGLGQYAGLASIVGIDIGGKSGGIFQSDNIVELYRSRTMIQKALLSESDSQGELLIDRYIKFKGLRESWSTPELTQITFMPQSGSGLSRLQDSVLGTVVKDINRNILNVVKPDKKLSIIKVEVQASDETFAKNFNDQIVKNVNDFYVQTKTKKSLANVEILQQKTDSVRSVMNGAVYRAVAVADATPNLNPTRQVQRLVPIQRSELSVETNKIILGELIKNLELSKMALRQEVPLIQIIDRPIFPLEREKLSEIKGLMVGGLIGAFLAVFCLIVRRALKIILE